MKDTIDVFTEKRDPSNVITIFGNVFCRATSLASVLGVDLRMPRITGRQTNRSNIETDCVESYFRATIYVPLIESVVEDLRQRLPWEVLNVYCLNCLLPRNADNKAGDSLAVLTAKYCSLLGLREDTLHQYLQAEFTLWQRKWNRDEGAMPSTAVEAIAGSVPELYPHILSLLRILATLPVSGATAERSFSTLRRLKTWIGSRCGERRLTGLALLNIHRDITIKKKSIIERFARGDRRKRLLLL